MTRFRIAAAAAACVALAAAVPGHAGRRPQSASQSPARGPAPLVVPDVPVQGGGTLRGLVGWVKPGDKATARRVPTRTSDAPAEVAAAPDAGPPPGSRSTTFPADTGHAPGTVYSVAGGDCEAYPRLEASVRPTRIAYDRHGTLFFVDLMKDNRGSALIRYVDRSGRVRTLAPLFPPEEGRSRRLARDPYHVTLVPDDRGGVYVNRGEGTVPTFRTEPPLDDVPVSNDLVHIDRHGGQTLVVGGLPAAQGVDGLKPGYGDGDPIARTSLTEVQGFALDPDGSIYFADALAGGFFGSRIRFANRSERAVTFYPGTSAQVTIEPGRVGTIAGGSAIPLSGAAGSLLSGGGSQPVHDAQLGAVPRIEYVNGLLYLSTTRWNGVIPGRAQPATVSVVNLFGREPVVAHGLPVDPGHIRIVAGDFTRSSGYSGDGGPATLAQLGFDFEAITGDFVVDRRGDLYISDSRNNRIRRVDPLGIITTVAGTGLRGRAGPSGTLALASPLWYPLGIDEVPGGLVAFADLNNGMVRALTADGRLEQVLGRGPYPCGDGLPATGPGVYDGASFRTVTDMAVDSHGRTYVADAGHKTIRRLDRDGRIELTIGQARPCSQGLITNYDFPADLATWSDTCPNGAPPAVDVPLAQAEFAQPNHLLVDAYDNLFVSDLDAIRYVNLLRRPLSVLGKAVPPLSVVTLHTFGSRTVHFSNDGSGLFDDLPTLPIVGPIPRPPVVAFDVAVPIGEIAVDAQGGLYVADPLLNAVFRIGPCGDVALVAGDGRPSRRGDEGDGGPAIDASIHPTGLVFDQDTQVLYLIDRMTWQHSRVRAVNRSGAPRTVLGRAIAPDEIDTVVGTGPCSAEVCSAGDGGTAYEAILDTASIELRPGGSLLLAEENTHRIRLVDAANTRIYGIVGTGPDSGGKTQKHIGDFPAGYLGDGGPALGAWTSGTAATVPMGAPSKRIPVATTPDDALLFGDGLGRVRRVDAVSSAPRRIGGSVATVPDAGVGFSDTVLLPTTPTSTEDTGPARPRLVTDGRTSWVVGASGSARGCRVWKVTTDADGRGHDAGTERTMPGVAGVPAGGGRCALGAAAGSDDLSVVTPTRIREGDVLGDETALYAGSSADGGASWTPGVAGLPGRVGALGADDVVVATDGTTHSLVYGTSDGKLTIAESSDGSTYLDVATVNAGQVAIGDYLMLPGGQRMLALVTKVMGLFEAEFYVEVLRSTDGRSWTSERVARIASPATTSPPALAAVPGGPAYAAWGDGTGVQVARSVAPGRWAAPVRVPTGPLATNPGLAVDRAGTLLVGYLSAPLLRAGSPDNPYAEWYVHLARGTFGATGARWETRVATTEPVHRGKVCQGEACVQVADATAQVTCIALGCGVLGANHEAGPVRVSLAANGDVHLVFTVAAGLGANREGFRQIGHVRPCIDLKLAASGARTRCAPAVREVFRPAPVLPPRPDPPTVPVGVNCSPAPPPFRRPAPVAPPPPKSEPHRPVPARPEPLPPAVVIPFVPLPPVQPALPPGQAPAPSTQVNQAQQSAQSQQLSSQTQPGAQSGLAAAEEAEAQRARSFAASRRSSSPYPSTALLWALVGGFALTGAAATRTRHPARCYGRVWPGTPPGG